MKDFVITCCSTVDLTKQKLDQNQIQYIPFHYQMDGIEYRDDFGETMPLDAFYKRMKEGATPTTSQVNSEEYIEFWEPFVQNGQDILHITLSSGISGTLNSAVLAQRYLVEKYPEAKIYVVDSLGASSGYGLLVEMVAELKASGKNIDECRDWVEEHKLNVHHWFFSTDLTSYKRGGRISATSFFLGQLLKICPLLNMDNLGRLIPRKKIRTKEKVIQEIVNQMEKYAEGGTTYQGKCFICHSAVQEDANKVKDLVEKRFPNLVGAVEIYSVGTTIGSHTGPGTVALFFMGSKRID